MNAFELVSSLIFIAEEASHAPAAVSGGGGFVEMLLFRVVDLGVLTIAAGMLLSLYRVGRGPHLADRVLASDVFSIHVAALVILLTVRLNTLIFFDVALGVAIIGFVSTLAFAQYIGSRTAPAEG